MRIWIAIIAVALVAMLVVACGGGEGSKLTAEECLSGAPMNTLDADVTVEEVVDRIATAITCRGFAFHLRSSGDTELGPDRSHQDQDIWIDMDGNRSRLDWVNEALNNLGEVVEMAGTTIVRADGKYSGQTGFEGVGRTAAPICHGAGTEAISLLIFCAGPSETLVTRIELGASYRDRSAVALATDGEVPTSNGTFSTTSRVFFDHERFFPMGVTIDGTIDLEETYPVVSDIPYDIDFVPLDSLPADFFDPASIGYVEREEES